MHLLIGLLAALLQRDKTGVGQHVRQSMQASVLNLCRVKLRDQLILEHTGRLTNYPQYPNGVFGDTVPRSGNIEGGGVFGWCYKCKGWETDPNAYVYIVLQREDKAFEAAAKALGKPEWINDPKFSTAEVEQIKRGKYLTVGMPMKFSDFTPEIKGAPLLGQDTDPILAGLGYTQEQIVKLRNDKVVA